MDMLIKELRYAAWGTAVLNLVSFLIALFFLKSPIGVHFAADGAFDVFASKFYGFYPHGISALCIGIMALADLLTDKVKTGLKVTERGDQALRTTMHLGIGWGRLLVVLFFCYWNVLVIVQQPLQTVVPSVMIYLLLAGGLATAIAFCVIRIRCRRKERADA